MMTFRLPSRCPAAPLLAAPVLAALLGTSGCGEKAATAEEEPTGQGAEEFYHPRKGERWKYRVQREIPLEVKLSASDKARRPERTESGHLITFERVRTCTGTRKLPGSEKEFTTMEIAENGTVLGEEFYDLNPAGVFSLGWIAHGAKEVDADNLLEEGVALATTKMQPGQIWKGTGLNARREFLFRVIEFTKVKVPAGSFDAARIQITSELDGKALKRSVWFAANVGIVKEESVYYGTQRTRVRERAELIHWVVPSGAPPAEQSLVTATTDDPQTPKTPEDEEGPEDPVADEEPEEGETEDSATEDEAKKADEDGETGEDDPGPTPNENAGDEDGND